MKIFNFGYVPYNSSSALKQANTGSASLFALGLVHFKVNSIDMFRDGGIF